MSAQHFIGGREYFSGIGTIPFEGRDSDNPLSLIHISEPTRPY